MAEHEYALLKAFRGLFQGSPYLHRKSNLGNFVASQLYEDLVTLNKSAKLTERVHARERVVNLRNVAIGKPARRGDGTFGEIVPIAVAIIEKGILVARGPVQRSKLGRRLRFS